MALLIYHVCSFFLLYSLVNSHNLCDPKESSNLLEFKKAFSLSEFAQFSNCLNLSPKTATWNDSTDCCSWDGVECNDRKGEVHVVGLDISCSRLNGTLHPNSTIFTLSHLQSLNLSFNFFYLSPFSTQFGTFMNLKVLDLSSSHFQGDIPIEISHLSNLVSLDLSNNYDLKFSNLVMNQVVHNLTNLMDFALTGVDLSSITPTSFMNFSLFLTSLRLSWCGLSGNFPDHILSLPNLRVLSLVGNMELKGHLPMSNWSKPLEILDLRLTNYSREIPNSIGNAKFLRYLDLGFCKFTGGIPNSIGNLKQLNIIGLSKNKFNGQLPNSLFHLTQLSYVEASSTSLSGPLCVNASLENLIGLFLEDNLLIGAIPSWLYALPRLKYLDLSNNRFIHAFMGDFKSNSLMFLDLSETNLQGGISESIYRQLNLTNLRLRSNNLSGILNLDILSRIQCLTELEVSNNNQLSIHSTNVSFGNITLIGMGSLKLEKFPNFLRHQKNLRYLDLSNNQIRGEIPTSQPFFKASNNQLSGNIHPSIFWQATNLTYVDLSNNSLSGVIPHSICHATNLIVLSLSNNCFSGTIPSCLGNITFLKVLDLKSNKFSGTLPTIFPTGSQLMILNLNDNQIEGQLPRSLLNCENLQLLDLGNNKITGHFPYWLEAASNLRILILRSNRFYGHINISINQNSFSNIQIIDLSQNHFIGWLPSNLFENLRAMKDIEMGNQEHIHRLSISTYYQIPAVVSVKGLDQNLEKFIMIFKVIDLSSNDFSGEIPKSIGTLMSLIGLNLSHNKLTGEIPMSFGTLTNLEWLDLSSNKLSGNIPLQLVPLIFLSLLNLSHNQLSGPIPLRGQFATFENSSYIGNLGLCGVPLPKCDAEKNPKSQLLLYDEEDEILEKGFLWRVAFMGYGCGMVFGIFAGYIVFRIGKPVWIVTLVENKRAPNIQRSRRRNCRPRKTNE